MSVTPEQLAEKRLRAEQLRQQITMLEFASREDQADAELANQDAALDAEIALLEKQRDEKVEVAVRQARGGSVAEALAAMEAAERDAQLPVTAPSSRPALGSPTSTEGEGSK